MDEFSEMLAVGAGLLNGWCKIGCISKGYCDCNVILP